jgi:hypothetical protein
MRPRSAIRARGHSQAPTFATMPPPKQDAKPTERETKECRHGPMVHTARSGVELHDAPSSASRFLDENDALVRRAVQVIVNLP